MKLSIIIPVYNEAKTVATVLEEIMKVRIPNVSIEVIIIDDGSTDATALKISKVTSKVRNLKFLSHEKNMGKGVAVRSGIESATGDYILIQDADLEYNPKDISKLTSLVLAKAGDVVYGTRLDRLPDFKKDERTFQFAIHYFGNRLLSLLTSILYGQWITDMETGYKLFPRVAVKNMNLRAKGFEFEPEITAKLLKEGYRIVEVPIQTNPRGYGEGKKLNTVKDGWKALWALVKFRFID